MREILDLMPLVLQFAPACPEPTALVHLRQAAIKLCQRSRVWRERKEFTVEGGCDELICMPDYAAIHEIEAAWWNGSEMRLVGYPATDGVAHAGVPYGLTQLRPDTVRLAPGAAERGTLILDVFMKPSSTAEDIPDFLANHHDQLLADGALARILMLPGQQFYNPAMAQGFAGVFREALDKEFNTNVRGQQRGPARARARYL